MASSVWRYLFGLLQLAPEEFLRAGVSDDDAKQIEQLIVERDTARAEKDWAAADRIRDKLTEMRVVLEDKAGKTAWRKIM